jgi:CysZ protein
MDLLGAPGRLTAMRPRSRRQRGGPTGADRTTEGTSRPRSDSSGCTGGPLATGRGGAPVNLRRMGVVGARGPVAGPGALLAALDLLRQHPRLRRYVVTPILVNLVIAVVLYTTLVAVGLRAVDRLVPDAAGGAGALTVLLQLLLAVALFFSIGFLLVRFGVVLGSPWYGRLSEEVERIRTGAVPPAPPFTLAGAAGDIARALSYEVRKLTLVLVAGGALLVIQVIPGLGQLAGAAGGFTIGSLVACLDFFDGPLERSRLSFGQKLGFVRRTAPASIGFGMACAALLAVPVLNLLAIPVCMAAGTLFVVDRRGP